MSPEAKEKICFVISPIGPEGSDIRDRADKVFKYIIEPVVLSFGYKAIRADHISDPGLISQQVINFILEAPLVIADLTNKNPNVFYELAFTHAARKACIQIIDTNEQLPFDVSDTRTIKFDYRDLESVAQAKEQIKNQIKSIEASPDNIRNPITAAIDIKLLQESGDPQKESSVEIFSMLQQIQSQLARIVSSAPTEASFIKNPFKALASLDHPLTNTESYEGDELLPDAIALVRREGKASSTLLQTRFSIGYARAARLIATMEALKVIGEFNGAKPREVLEQSKK